MTDQNYNLLDLYFARFLADRTVLSGVEKERFIDLIRTLSSSLEAGHSCLLVTEETADFLAKIPLVSNGDSTPLVLYKNRLYLHRYFYYETRLAKQISAMAAVELSPIGIEALLKTSFPESQSDGHNWQKKAARLALHKVLTIICGGPGTGKTNTVAKILVLLLQVVGPGMKIALAAPTGKAAMRLSESIAKNIQQMDILHTIRAAIPVEAKTLHRLLGVKMHSPQFRHCQKNPMDWDMVVIDEASMVDLAMMSKVTDALKPGARLLLLGDKDQLSSVESGAVFGDLVENLPDNTVELQKTYRFDNNIKRLSDSINSGNCEEAWQLLQTAETSNLGLLQNDFMQYIGHKYAVFMTNVYRNHDPDIRRIFAILNNFQVLCGVHFNSRGVEGINRNVERLLTKQGFDCQSDPWYQGRPILVGRNDYQLDLYNGDIGICLLDRQTGEKKVWFERSDGSLTSYPPHRLPPCQTVFAMTIHKAQGSEFDEVIVVLPAEDNRILSRELVYTAVTRARKSVKLVAKKNVLQLALSRNIKRSSGLADSLCSHLES